MGESARPSLRLPDPSAPDHCFIQYFDRPQRPVASEQAERAQIAHKVSVASRRHLASFTDGHHLVATLRTALMCEFRRRSRGGSRFAGLCFRTKKAASAGCGLRSSTGLKVHPKLRPRSAAPALRAVFEQVHRKAAEKVFITPIEFGNNIPCSILFSSRAGLSRLQPYPPRKGTI